MFSLYKYTQLPDTQKDVFKRILSQGLIPFRNEIKNDLNLNSSLIENFISSAGKSTNSESAVEDLYSIISSGVQAGSGNQNLFLGILEIYAKSWKETNRQL